LVEPQRTEIGNSYTVKSQIPWSQEEVSPSFVKRSGKVQIWTVDGPRLQEIRFVSGIDDGEAPFQVKDREEEKNLKFRKDMTFLEVQDLVVDGIATTGAHRLGNKNLRPAGFGGHDGFRFEIDFVTEEGLEKSGFVVGSIIKEKLYLIIYSGARVHYFAKHKKHVEDIIESVQMKD